MRLSEYENYIDLRISELNKQYKTDMNRNIQEILELQTFFENIFGYYKSDEYNNEEYFRRSKKFICIFFRSTEKLKGRSKNNYNKFFDFNRYLNPLKHYQAPLSYILYHLRELDIFELYFAPTLFKKDIENKNFGRKEADSVIFSNSIFVDIDMDMPNKNKEEWITYFNKTYAEIIDYLPPSYIVKSGGGLHLYYLNNTESVNSKWTYNRDMRKEISIAISNLFDADMSVAKDISRVLRVPFSYNRKEKYGEPQKVEIILKDSEHRYEYSNFTSALDLLNIDFLNNMSDEMMNSYIYDESNIEGFEKITDQEELNMLDEIERNFINIPKLVASTDDCSLTSIEIDAAYKDVIDSIVAEDIVIDFKTAYKRNKPLNQLDEDRLALDFNRFGERQYRVLDILFWLANRNFDIEGFRYNCLFLLEYCWYCYDYIRNETELINKAIRLNNEFTIPLGEAEIQSQVKDLIKSFEVGNENGSYVKNIKNDTISQYLKYQDLEISYMIGTYNVTEAEKTIIVRKRENSRISFKRDIGEYTYNRLMPEKYKTYFDILEEYPGITAEEFKEKTTGLIANDKGIGRRRFFELKKLYKEYKNSNYQRLVS